MNYPRVMSFSDPQRLIPAQAECRNLFVACATAEHYGLDPPGRSRFARRW